MTVNLTPPSVNDVVAGGTVPLTAQVLVNGTPLELTTADDVTFAASGGGTFGAKSVVAGDVVVNYTTRDLIETATITATENVTGSGYQDTSTITSVAGSLVALTVLPNTATLSADDTRQFTATGVDANGNPAVLGTIAWSVNGGIGTIASGLFNATTVGSGSVTATSSIGGIGDTSGAITVTAGALANLVMSPAGALALTADQTQQFSVSGTDADGNPAVLGTINWSVNGGIGTIDSGGLFNATTPGTGSVTATSSLGRSVNSGTITVAAGALANLVMSPAGALALTADQTQQFSVSGTDADGNPAVLGTINWSVNGGIGTIASGLFNATTPGSGSVTATSSLGRSVDSGTITVTAGALANLVMSPAGAVSLTADQTQQFSVSGTDTDGNPAVLGTINWSVSGRIGSIDSSGLFNATTTGSGSVTATSSLGKSGDSGTITVSAGALDKIIVTPETATVVLNRTQQFQVAGQDADQNTVTEIGTITWSATGGIGTIDSGTGLFTATTEGTGTVTATSTLGKSDTSGTITVTRFSATADHDVLVTVGNPHEAKITAIGATTYKWYIDGAVSSVTGNELTFTAPSSITEGTAGHLTVIRVEDASNSSINFPLTLTTYEPVRFIQPAGNVGITHDGAVKTYQLQVAGGNGTYNYQVRDGTTNIIEVSGAGLVTGKAVGSKRVYVWDTNGAAATDNSFRAQSFIVEVVNTVVVTPATETVWPTKPSHLQLLAAGEKEQPRTTHGL